jgi:hypothetical protein
MVKIMFEIMFEDIGRKIMMLAKVVCWLGIIVSVIGSFVLFANDAALIGFAVMIGGSLGSWISSMFIYGFGQLTENTDRLGSISIVKYVPVVPPTTCTNNDPENEIVTPKKAEHKWRCDSCQNMRTQSPCEYCGSK